MGTRLLYDPSTVRRPMGSCGSPAGDDCELTWFGPGPSSDPPAACACATWICLKMKRRSSSLMTKPLPTGATCCCALTVDEIERNCDPPLVISAIAAIITIAHGRAQRVRRHVSGLDAYITPPPCLSSLSVAECARLAAS